MKSYRFSLIALLIHLTVFFNIERLDFGAENIIDIDTSVYVLTIIAILLVIAVNRVAQVNLIFGYIFWLGVYLTWKLVIDPTKSPLLGGIYTYISITEVTFLVVALVLAHNVADKLDDVEQTIMGITLLGASDKVKMFDEARDNIKMEIYRSRRFEIPISLLLLSPDDSSPEVDINQTIEEFQDDILKHYTIVRLARILSKMTRRTDLLMLRFETNEIMLLSLGIDKDNASSLANKVKDIAKKNLNLDLNVGITTLPNEAETFERMYQLANAEIRGQSGRKLPEPEDEEILE